MHLSPELITKLAPLEIKARQIVEGFISGLHRSPFYGFSVEFAEHRPYSKGDELRHIDWKVYGKTERFYVKQYEAETNLRCQVLFDVSRSMDFKHFGAITKRQFGTYLTAAFLYIMHRQRDAVGLTLFDEEIREHLLPRSSESHIRHLFKILESAEELPLEKRRTSSAKAIHRIAEQLKNRSLVVIVSDLFENANGQDALIDALKHLRHKNHEVILFHISEHRSEREFDFGDRKLQLEDMETGSTVELLPQQVAASYRALVQQFTGGFRALCSQTRIDFEEVDTEGRFDLALLAYLNKRARFSN